jgi:putative nucleotidyltransferase with HDIG domain
MESSVTANANAMRRPVDFFEKVEPLPTAPTILPKLLTALANPNVNVDEVVNLVVHEPALAAKVLKLCNSALFAGAEPTAHVSDAVYRIGFYNVYRLVVAACGEHTLDVAKPEWGVDIRGLWKHSVVTGLAAELLAGACGEDEGVLFTAGLLHDFGKLIFAGALRSAYGSLTSGTHGNPAALLEVERQHCHIEHAELGGALLERWNFPVAVVSAVRFHHSPESAGDFSRVASLVTIADRLAHLMNATACSGVEVPGLSYAFETFEFSRDHQKTFLDRLRGMLNQAEIMSLS